MSDDPRLDAATIAIIQEREQTPWLDNWAKAALVASDAADPLRRALTPGTDEHEALVERATAMIYSRAEGMLSERESRPIAKSVLAALRDLA
jgi:hypothetical protein